MGFGGFGDLGRGLGRHREVIGSLEGQIANHKTLAIWNRKPQVAFQLLVEVCPIRKSHDFGFELRTEDPNPCVSCLCAAHMWVLQDATAQG